MRVLILTWEYPPIVEGGLARHVRKLSENLVAQGVEVRGASGYKLVEMISIADSGGGPSSA